jgi:hypothetical protein
VYPDLLPVRQKLWSKRVADLDGEVERLVRRSKLAGRVGPGFSVAIAAGSRGVANVDRIVAAVARTVRALGGEPFVVPAMGSHGGATAEGQVQMLAELGMTEQDVPRIADLAVANPYANPRPVTRDGVEALLRAAWAGEPPPVPRH